MSQLAINGGNKACDHEWLTWPIWGDEERKNLNAVLESGQWWFGARVHEFEEKFAAFQGAKYGITSSSGTTALEVTLLANGIGAGDEVIVPPYTFMATASAVLRVNAVPVFADILGENLCIDPDDVQRKITPKTRAIIPVHLGGHMADMDRLNEIAKKYNLVVIEDACHAWGSQWKGKGAGAVGNCGVFSFQASKNISSAEGGIILTDDEALADTCRSFTNCGRGKDTPWYQHFLMGSNLRLTEFQGAILLAQLTRLEKQTLKRQVNAEILNKGLADLPGIQPITNDPRMTRRSYHIYCYRMDSEKLGVSRQRLLDALQAEGVPTGAGYPTPLYGNPLFQRSGEGSEYCPVTCPYYDNKMDYSKVCCPVCEAVCEDTCWITHAVLLSEEEAMHDIVKAFAKVVENIKEL